MRRTKAARSLPPLRLAKKRGAQTSCCPLPRRIDAYFRGESIPQTFLRGVAYARLPPGLIRRWNLLPYSLALLLPGTNPAIYRAYSLAYTRFCMASTPSSPVSGYRGRLAPSPTGYLHVGHARTFWTAFQHAREAGGTLVMRMEDLDPDRSRPAYADAAIEDLSWLGIRWQEGPDKGGPFAPYVQSKRRSLYLAAWRRLLRRGCLFPCRCSRKDLETALGAPHERVQTASGSRKVGHPG